MGRNNSNFFWRHRERNKKLRVKEKNLHHFHHHHLCHHQPLLHLLHPSHHLLLPGPLLPLPTQAQEGDMPKASLSVASHPGASTQTTSQTHPQFMGPNLKFMIGGIPTAGGTDSTRATPSGRAELSLARSAYVAMQNVIGR